MPTWTHEQSTSVAPGAGAPGALAYGSNVKAGSLLIACYMCEGDQRDTTATDTRGNIWFQIGAGGYDATNDITVTWLYAIANGAGANSVTLGSAGTAFQAFIIAEFSVTPGTIALNKQAGQQITSTTTGTDATTSPAVATTTVDEFVLGCVSDSSNVNIWAAGTNFTERQDQAFTGGSGGSMQLESRVLAAPGSVQATWTAAGAGARAFALVATFMVPGDTNLIATPRFPDFPKMKLRTTT